MRYLPRRYYLTQRAESIVVSLLRMLLQDLIGGVKKGDAGWRTPVALGMLDTDVKELLDVRAVERNAKGELRFNMDNRQLRKALYSVQQELTQLDYFLEKMPVIERDRKRVRDAERFFDQVRQLLEDHPENWTYVIWIGWWKMLESSGLPASVDDVLQEGFSPKDWAIEVSMSCPGLALTIAEKFGDIRTIHNAQGYFKENNLVPPDESISTIEREETNKTKRILRWEELTDSLDVELVRMLAFVWASLYFLENRNLITTSEEVSLALYDTIWTSVKALLNEDQAALLNKLKSTINVLTERGVVWSADILRVPEVI